MNAAVLVFVRAPHSGRVKTRLAADIGAVAALEVYRRLGRHTVDVARAVGSGVTVRIHYTPDAAGSDVERWLGGGVEYGPQGGGGLGERVHRAFTGAFASGCDRVVIVGSDLPDLTPDLLRRALALLDECPVVIGPACDGGYYLVGMREMVPGIFRDIPWSTDRVLSTTLQRLAWAGVEPALLDPLADVDTIEDLPGEWEVGLPGGKG